MFRILRYFCLLLVLLSGVAQAYDREMVLYMLKTQEEIAGLNRSTITLGGHKLSYLDNGNARAARTVVLVHGFGDSSLSWTFMARAFRDGGYRIVIPDLLGFGDSARPVDGDYSYKAQASRVLALMKQLNIASAHVVGNSMGGGVAAEMAVLQPQAVASLTLMDAAGVHYRPSQLDQEMLAGRNLLVAKTPEDFDRIIDFVCVQRPLSPRPIVDFLAERAVKDSALHEKIFREVLFPDINFLLLDLGRIQAPTLVLWGEKDRVLNPENAKVFKQYIPRSELVILPNVGHVPMIEVPEQSAAAVRQFIEKQGV